MDQVQTQPVKDTEAPQVVGEGQVPSDLTEDAAGTQEVVKTASQHATSATKYIAASGFTVVEGARLIMWAFPQVPDDIAIILATLAGAAVNYLMIYISKRS